MGSSPYPFFPTQNTKGKKAVWPRETTNYHTMYTLLLHVLKGSSFRAVKPFRASERNHRFYGVIPLHDPYACTVNNLVKYRNGLYKQLRENIPIFSEVFRNRR